MTRLSSRDTELRELMDDPACDPERLRRTLERFAIVNRLVSGWGGVYRARVRPLARRRAEGSRPLRILDIGCGGGDVLRRLVSLARADGIDVAATGIDPDERSLAVARRHPTPGIEYLRVHSADLVAEGRRFDAVISNHVLHHLDSGQLAGLLADSDALSEGLVLHSDIARSRAAYAGYAIGITPLAPGSLLRTDGLRSIRRSFTAAELAALLPRGWRVERPARFRLLAVRVAPAGATDGAGGAP